MARVSSLLDRVALAVSPAWAVRREQNKAMLRVLEIRQQELTALAAYAAAEKNRTTGWRSTAYSADGAILPDVSTINAVSRGAVRSNWAAKSIVRAYTRHVIGDGITCRSSARDPFTNESLDGWNERGDRLWDDWCSEPSACDIERRKTFFQIQRLICREFTTAGEVLIILRTGRSTGPVQLAVQMLEPEQLATDMIRSWSKEGNEIRNGIEIDEYGAPVAYWIYDDSHPLDGRYTAPKRIVASKIIHIFDQERPRQSRGVSELASVLTKLSHLDMYDNYQLVRAKLEACIGAALTGGPTLETSPASFGLAGSSGTTTDVNGNLEMNIEPGMMLDLRSTPGADVKFFDPKAPGTLYDPFTKRQIHQIAAGVGLDYSTVARDFTGGTFSSQREGHLERDKETDAMQEIIIGALKRIRREFIKAAILGGALPDPGYWGFPDFESYYTQADWQPPAKPWIDPANQAAAAEKMLQLGLATVKSLNNEQGEDWREVARQQVEEEKFRRDLRQAAGLIGANNNGADVKAEATGQTPGTNRPEGDAVSVPAGNGAVSRPGD